MTDPDLLALLGDVVDHRCPRGRRFTLASLSALGLSAVLTGARSFVAIAEWARAQPGETWTRLAVARALAPEVTTFPRAFAGVDADRLDCVLGAYLWTRTGLDREGRRIIAVDAETVRGARTSTRRAAHLVAGFDHASGGVLGQLAVDAKSNEIPALRTLWGRFDLTGAVVTVDAMPTQIDTPCHVAYVDHGVWPRRTAGLPGGSWWCCDTRS